MDDKKLATFKQRVESIGELPVLSPIATEAMALATSPRSSMSDMARVISKDPSLAAKLLKVANSAYYGLRRKVDTIRHALVILGMNEVSSLILSLSILETFPIIPGKPTFDREKFWEHSAGCGVFARILAIWLKYPMNGAELTAGLLHDIGKIVMDHFFHNQFMKILELCRAKGLPLLEAEKQVMGVTHPEIGGWLAEKWNLPVNLVEAICFHHDPSSAQVNRILVAVVHLADILCKFEGIGFGGELKGVSLVDDVAWGIIRAEVPGLDNLDVERLSFELEELLDEVQDLVRLCHKTEFVEDKEMCTAKEVAKWRLPPLWNPD